MERVQEMIKLVLPDLERMIQERCIKMKEIEEFNKKEILAQLKELMKHEQSLQATCLVISYLRTSYITGSHKFKVALYEKQELFVDINAPHFLVPMGVLFQQIEQDLSLLLKVIGQKMIRVLPSEAEELRRYYLERLYQESLGYFQELLKQDIVNKNILFGEEMGETCFIKRLDAGSERVPEEKYFKREIFHMEYFILRVSENYIEPRLKDWYKKLDMRTLNNKKRDQMPNHLVIPVQEHMQMVFTDIILFPCLLVSKKVKQVITVYEPRTRFVRVILHDKRRKRSKVYYLPWLQKVDCLTKGSQLNLDRSYIHHAQLDGERLKDHALLQVANVNTICILVRLDLAESLLRRRAIGIGLQETEVV